MKFVIIFALVALANCLPSKKILKIHLEKRDSLRQIAARHALSVHDYVHALVEENGMTATPNVPLTNYQDAQYFGKQL